MAKLDLNGDDEKVNIETIFWSAMDMLSDDEMMLEKLIKILPAKRMEDVLKHAFEGGCPWRQSSRCCILSHIAECAKHDRNVALRARCCDYAFLILEYWADAPEIQHAVDLCEDLIKCCVGDAMSESSTIIDEEKTVEINEATKVEEGPGTC
ncbi:hypothetical protein AgCh_011744 [Apium graveolens]